MLGATACVGILAPLLAPSLARTRVVDAALIATLIGVPASKFKLAQAVHRAYLPDIPIGLPASLPIRQPASILPCSSLQEGTTWTRKC